jgi:acyl-CoA thioester hydrolase
MSRDPLHPRSSYRHWQVIQTRWADNDVYGHVNNTIHYQWFDTVVNSWLITQGLLGGEPGNPIGLVVETGCRYARPVSFPETVDIGLALDRLGGSSVTYRLGVFSSGSDEPAAQGHFTHVCVDPDSRRPVSLPPDWREAISRLT